METNLRNRLFSNNLVWIAIPKLSGIQIPHQIVRKELISQIRSKFSRVMSYVAKMCVFLAIGSFGPRFRWPSAHSKDRHAGDCCSYTRHWKCPQIVPVVEGELPLLLIYYRVSPILGWRVIEQPGTLVYRSLSKPRTQKKP